MLKKTVLKNRKKKLLIAGLSLLVLIILCSFLYVYHIYQHTKVTVDEKMHYPVKAIDTSLTKKKLNELENINILLLGIDAVKGEKGRSDAIMVVQLAPSTDEMKIVSIPRDTYAEIVGYGKMDKINHAYAFGGPETAVASVEQLLSIDLDYFVTLNMDGLVEMIDELGTITVQNDVAWSDAYNNFPEGETVLDGERAIDFVRMRKLDPNGDFGRTDRQRKVIKSMIREGAGVGSIPKISRLVTILGKNMQSNMTFSDIERLFLNYKETTNEMEEYMLSGEGKKIDGIFYLIVPDHEIEKAHRMLSDS